MSPFETVNRVIVVGAGQMGSGIAHAFAQAQFSVSVVDPMELALTRARQHIKNIFQDGVQRNRLTEVQMKAALGRLHFHKALRDVEAPAEHVLLVESAVESLDIKQRILAEADELLALQTVFATNTSALSVTELGAKSKNPARVVGMHFFNPVHKMKLVEVVRGMATADVVMKTVEELAARLGKTTIAVNESPGLTTSRMSALLGNEAMYMLESGVASAEDIDKGLRLGFNHPMGPLELGDLTGWDTRLAVLQYLHNTLGEKFRPCPLILKLVKSGRVGIKAGRGVYDYQDGQRVVGSGLRIR